MGLLIGTGANLVRVLRESDLSNTSANPRVLSQG